MKVAGMAEAFNLPVVSHLIPEIHVHLIAAIPNGPHGGVHAVVAPLFEETPAHGGGPAGGAAASRASAWRSTRPRSRSSVWPGVEALRRRRTRPLAGIWVSSPSPPAPPPARGPRGHRSPRLLPLRTSGRRVPVKLARAPTPFRRIPRPGGDPSTTALPTRSAAAPTPPAASRSGLHVGTGSPNETEPIRGIAHYLGNTSTNGSTNFPPARSCCSWSRSACRSAATRTRSTGLSGPSTRLRSQTPGIETIDRGLLFPSDVASGSSSARRRSTTSARSS